MRWLNLIMGWGPRIPGAAQKAAAPPVRPLVTAHIQLLIDKVLPSLSVGMAALAPASHLCCRHDSDRTSEVLGMEHTEPFSEDADARGLGLAPLPAPGTAVASLGPLAALGALAEEADQPWLCSTGQA